MKHWMLLALGVACFATLPLISQDSNSSAKPPVKPRAAGSVNTNESADGNGERKFQQNCSRCHQAPEGFPPHISGTIIRHMRVRASLSAQDERDILRFLNP